MTQNILHASPSTESVHVLSNSKLFFFSNFTFVSCIFFPSIQGSPLCMAVSLSFDNCTFQSRDIVGNITFVCVCVCGGGGVVGWV